MGTRKNRDFQRKRVYRAESRADIGKGYPEKDIISWSNIVSYVKSITTDSRFVDRYGVKTIEVKDGRGTRIARGWGGRFVDWGVVSLPKWARSRLVTLHEIAHTITDDKHGPEFCGEFMWLVYTFIGEDVYLKLRASFIGGGVKFNETVITKRPTTNDIVQNILRNKKKRKKTNPTWLHTKKGE